MSDSWNRGVRDVGEKGRPGGRNDALTKSAKSPPQPSHSRNSSWNIHDGLFNELEGFPSVSMNNQSNSVTSDDVISAQCFGGYTSPVRRPAHGMEGVASRRRSVTPQKTGVRGVAMRLASCEKEDGRRLEAGLGPPEADQSDQAHRSVPLVQMDTAPRTSYTGILKKLEFQSGGYTDVYASENLQNTKLIFSRLKSTLEERGTPVGARTTSAVVPQHLTPVGRGLRETATKKLMFTMTSSGEGAGSWEHGTGVPATMPSSTRFRGSARRVTFGRVSIDGERGPPIMEDACEGEEAYVEAQGDCNPDDGFSFQTMTYSAGSTPYSGKAYGEGRGRISNTRQGVRQNLVTKDQLASALKKSLNFAGAAEAVSESVEKRFSFGWGQLKDVVQKEDDQASTPGFSTFKSFKTTSRRFLTPPSCSPRLLELHGKARRVSGAGMVADVDICLEENDENTPVGEDATDSKFSKLSKFSLPRRLDVSDKGTDAKEGTKFAQLSSPTEVGIRNSLKLERTKRLTSASKFNSSSTP